MSVRLRWAIVALVLVVAGAIALWPREEAPTAVAPLPQPLPVQTNLPTCSRQGVAVETMQGLKATCLADGSVTDVAQAFAGPVLVNVWGTWCAPCREELPVLSAYAAEPGAIPVVTVSVQSEQATSVALLRDLGVRLPALLDKDESVWKTLHPPRMPSSYLITAQGEVNLVKDPIVFTSVADVRKAVGQ
nr:TlpA disulfide reductase family protein [Kibdelosporangium sp. MJ126-NF4]CEL23183.1 Cytochrome c-type biogenesis protein CcmG/DsbE, thiol:disulfide oxidoreductase [Kibdelosporangium sp. MJ126-NF4]CTQ94346.1 Cytochrome c-type biogenesis protein CcmG/DsbE, thiol:disulfide oxidoreductase [Kibdelosporangium sp. MJ126-NF4]